MADNGARLISAVHLATQKLSSAESVEETLQEVLELCVQAADAFGGTIYIHDAVNRRLEFRHVVPASVREKLPVKDIADDFGIAGKVFQTHEAVITFAEQQSAPGSAGGTLVTDRVDIEAATEVTVRSMLTAPLMVAGMEPIGVVQVINKRDGDFTQQDLEVVETVGSVSAMAYLNLLLREQVSRAASLMGMGKVSHDIGNLAAALHSSLMLVEPALEGLEGESSVVEEALGDLRESIDRIVGYSRLISDLSAGRAIRPTLAPGNFARCVEDAASYLETEARRSGVALNYEISEAAESLFDPQFIFRIVQNLVGNAIKAVRESVPQEELEKGEGTVYGSVTVRCFSHDGMRVIEVQDTGPGMPEAVVQRILRGNATSQWASSGGSGWGTKIVLELTSALGGTLEIESKVGAGATFRVLLPSQVVTEQ
jgi:signal transduction histidine kinase